MTLQARMTAVVVLVLSLASACSYANTGPDEFACAYGGGPFEAKKLKGEFAPGSGRDFVGVGDTIVTLPANVRNYIIDKDPGQGDIPNADFILAVAGDGIELEYEISARFRYNTSKGCTFWDEHGKRFDVDEDAGWNNFLAANMRPIFESNVKAATQGFSKWEPIWRNEPIASEDNKRAWQLIQDEVGLAMVVEVNRALGDDYFCGVTWTASSDKCPPFEILIKSVVPERESLTDRYGKVADEQAEEQRVRAEQQRENTRIELEAANKLLEQQARLERERDVAAAQVEIAELNLEAARADAEAGAAECIELAKEDIDCTLLEAARNGSIDFWVVGENTAAPQILRTTE